MVASTADVRTEAYRYAPEEAPAADAPVRLSAYLYFDRSSASNAERARAAAESVLVALLDDAAPGRSKVAPLATPGRFDVIVEVEGRLDGSTTSGEVRAAALYGLSRVLSFTPWEWATSGADAAEEAFYGLSIEDTGRRVPLGDKVRVRSGDLTAGQIVGAVEGGVSDSVEDVRSGVADALDFSGLTLLRAAWPILLIGAVLLFFFVVVTSRGGVAGLLGG